MKSINTALSLLFRTLAVLDRSEYTYSVGTQQCSVPISVASPREFRQQSHGLVVDLAEATQPPCYQYIIAKNIEFYTEIEQGIQK